jgi:hypothetical protein
LKQKSAMPTVNTLVIILAFAASIRYVWIGMHAHIPDPDSDRFSQAANTRDRGATGLLDYATACALIIIGCIQLAHVLSPAVAYGAICLLLACRVAAGLLAEERQRGRGRRAALLQRAPRIDPILLVWIALAALSVLVVAPSLFTAGQRAAGGFVAVSVVGTVLLAWRIATAPTLLSGDDVEAELAVDRTRRIRRTGLVAMTATAAASVYASFGEGSKDLSLVGFALYAAIGVSLMIYLRVASRRLVPS